MLRALQQHQDTVVNNLGEVIQGEHRQKHALELLNTWKVPLQAAEKQGIAQFKRGKLTQAIEVGG